MEVGIEEDELKNTGFWFTEVDNFAKARDEF